MVLILRVNRRNFFNKLSLLVTVIVILVFLLDAFAHTYKLLHSSQLPLCPNQEPIDVVYTWVNGSDPKFLQELNYYLKVNFRQDIDASGQRFDDKYELKFSLRSLEKFAPWVNHVYIVTNGQIPYWLNLDYEKVSIVTHEEIFKDRLDLPSFSSPAIECNLHRIPGLSKKFIYLNDDIFLGAPVYLEDFYSPNKGFLVYLAWPVPSCSRNCPWMYVADGQCDKACLNTECQLDGGDCENAGASSTEEIPFVFNYEPVPNKSSQDNYFQTKWRRSHGGKSNLTRLVLEHNQRVLRGNKRRKFPRKPRHNSTILLDFVDKLARKNLDAYSGSLQRTNRLLNRKYGFKTRKVPSHAPILIDREIMQGLEEVFLQELEVTQRNRFRTSDDVQFAFSYYYFVMSEIIRKNIGEVFDDFDTDASGTWSDREIRTLLSQLYELPLSYAIVDHFEAMLLNCSDGGANVELETPAYERYIDSRLPTISKNLVKNCAILRQVLLERFGKRPKYKYEIVSNAENNHVTFKMLNSNISDVVSHLDDIRSNLKKFICLNDNLDQSKDTENELIKSILYDFYLSLFPIPSHFELPKDYRNKFEYVSELDKWKRHHFHFKLFLYCVSVILVYVTFYSICKRRFCQFVNKLFCY